MSRSRTLSRPVSAAIAAPRSKSASASSKRPSACRAQPCSQNAGSRVASCAPLSRSSAAADSSRSPIASRPSPCITRASDTGRQRRQQENRIADRARVLARVARLGARLAQVARDQCRHGQREPQADPVLGRLRRQLGQRDVQPSPRVLVAAHPQLHVRDRHRERQARVAARPFVAHRAASDAPPRDRPRRTGTRRAAPACRSAARRAPGGRPAAGARPCASVPLPRAPRTAARRRPR